MKIFVPRKKKNTFYIYRAECHGALDKVIVTLSRKRGENVLGKAAVFLADVCQYQDVKSNMKSDYLGDFIFSICFGAVGRMPQLICTFF